MVPSSISNDLEYPSDGCVADGHDLWDARAQLDARHCTCAWTLGFRQLVWTPSNARHDGSETMQCFSGEHCWEEKSFICCRLLLGLVYKYQSVALEPRPIWLENLLLISPSVLSWSCTPTLCSFGVDNSVSHCFSQGCDLVVRQTGCVLHGWPASLAWVMKRTQSAQVGRQ